MKLGPYTLRHHQIEALAAIDSARRGGSSRLLVTMPPGAGKTVVGVALAHQLSTEQSTHPVRTVVFSPNTAIQQQWADCWNRCSSSVAGLDRTVKVPFTSLTYQALATFDAEADAATSVVERLHPRGQELIEALHTVGPLLVILDECHHLLDVWGELLRDVLDSLDANGSGEVTVLALTATPPRSLTRTELEQTRALFGDVLFEARTPALVKAGCLAPFQELAYLVTPTPAETDWLATQSERWQELRTDLLDPHFGSTPFLGWIDRRFTAGRPWVEVVETEPELADAVLRLAHSGLIALPEGASITEQHRHDATAADWVLLMDDWLLQCIAASGDGADEAVLEAVKRTLPSIDHVWTRRGIRKGPGAVDRVLARSAAKQRAAVDILAAEARSHPARLRALVLCDWEQATAITTRRLHDDHSPDPAGSSRALLAALLADPETAALAPMMVTGKAVAAAPETLAALRELISVDDPDLAAGLRIEDGELVGPWSSRQWVRAVTAFFTAGGTRALVGTRGLLGEGWDAPAITTLIDLTTVTTATAVTQTRGRALRLDPDDPDKTALIWTPICIAHDHVSGSNDWERFVRKHAGHFTLDEFGAVVDGVAGVDSTFSPFQPPDMEHFDRLNARMLTRAHDRDRVRRGWLDVVEFDDQVRTVVRMRSDRTTMVASRDVGRPPAPADSRVLPRLTSWWPAIVFPIPTIGLASGVVTGSWWLGPVIVVVAAVVTAMALGRARLARAHARPAGVSQVAAAIADAMHALGMSPDGSDSVRIQLHPSGEVSYRLDADEQASSLFATALDEATGPVAASRYLIRRPRYEAVGANPVRWARQALRLRPDGEFWHPVPTVFGAHAKRVAAYSRAWTHWVGGGETHFTGSAEGAGLLVALRGSDPFDVTSVIRSEWN